MTRRPPYALAGLATLLVLAGYVITLAPTVTFWDAGEFIAAAKSLGIPHPPGTPLFVLIGHVWAALVPLSEYAQRTNLLSATLSACGAGFMFLVVHDALAAAAADLEGTAERLVRVGGSFAAALVSGFTFTAWQNSNETEVYAAATFTIAAIAWLCTLWRGTRGTTRAAHLLLLILYLAGLSIGNHLLALLVGPAVVCFLASVLWYEPASTAKERAAEWAQVAVVAGSWALLIGCGLGSATLTALGAACFLAAAAFAVHSGTLPFAVVALAVSSIGVTSYLYLYIRAGQHPIINEAQPDRWDALLAVIRREQYPVRTPLDDPTVPHGPDNPGRSATIIGLQLLNYVQYFDWQWANGVRSTIGFAAFRFPLRTLATLAFFSLGLQGFLLHRRGDRSSWWLLFMLWLVTGLGLVAYMNFKPGFSMAYLTYPDSNDHEVRDRDYFFVVSFVVWGLWAGMGIASLARSAVSRWRLNSLLAAVPITLLALVPFVGNFTAASRRHGPDATLARDFAYDLLNSMPPYGILFTYGDNDTFPLWWAQEVNGIRQDVLVVCLALAETDWYKRQLRDYPTRPFDETAAPAIWKGHRPIAPTWRPHSLTDEQIARAEAQLLPHDITVQLGPVSHTLRQGTPIYSRDFAVLRLLQDNLGRRPIGWSLTTGGEYFGLDRLLLQQGLVMQLQTTPIDTTRADVDNRRILGVALDVPVTERLLWETYRYAGLDTDQPKDLEPTAAGIANNLSLPFSQLAYYYEGKGDRTAAVRNLTRAGRLSTNPGFRQALTTLQAESAGHTGP
jgi:Protein O-mannosyl-transferase TMEM260-like